MLYTVSTYITDEIYRLRAYMSVIMTLALVTSPREDAVRKMKELGTYDEVKQNLRESLVTRQSKPVKH